jgi:hypothetical protein
LLFFLSVYSCKEKEKSNAWALISVRGRNAPPSVLCNL